MTNWYALIPDQGNRGLYSSCFIYGITIHGDQLEAPRDISQTAVSIEKGEQIVSVLPFLRTCDDLGCFRSSLRLR